MKSLRNSITILITFLSLYTNAQENDTIPFYFETIYVGDGVRIFDSQSGAKNCYLGLTFVGMHINTEGLGLWKGGKFLIHGLNTHGATPTESYVGDIHTFSNLENGDGTFIYSFSYIQQVGKLNIIAGVNDLASTFQSSENASLLINSSFGVIPTISTNVPLSIFPKNALGLVLNYEITDKVSIGVASYDGNPGDLANDPYNINWKINKEEGFFNIGELRFSETKNDESIGIYRFGAYYHTADFENFNNAGSSIKGNKGFYVSADRNLKTLKNESRISSFLQLGYAPGDNNMIDTYWGLGLIYSNFSKKRAEDYVAISAASVSLNNTFVSNNAQYINPYDAVIEATYNLQISDNVRIQPDLQYMLYPGASKSVKDSFVGILRFELSFNSEN